MKIVILVALLLLTGISHAIFTPITISLSELTSPSAETISSLSGALSGIGLVAVKIDSDDEDFSGLRVSALTSAAKCAFHGKQGKEVVLEDGTRRYTLAAANEEDFEFSGHNCDQFDEVHGRFREIIASATEVFSDAVDAIQEKSKHVLMRDVVSGKEFETVGEIMRGGMSLEHFHTYHKTDQVDQFTIDLHSDHGLFIALIPAIQLNSHSNDHGFYIQMPNGEVVQPSFEDDVVVFMIGDGFNQWLNEKLPVPFRSVPHAVKISSKGERSWYGKMILPGENVMLDRQGKTFGELRSEMSSRKLMDNVLGNGVACSEGLSLSARQLDDTCGEDSILCWAGCKSTTALTCLEGESPQCARESLELCDPTQHLGPACAPRCIDTPENFAPTAAPTIPVLPSCFEANLFLYEELFTTGQHYALEQVTFENFTFEHDGEDAGLEYEFSFLGCNDTHFDVFFNATIWTFDYSVMADEVDLSGHGYCDHLDLIGNSSTAGDGGNCFSVRCLNSTQAGHDDDHEDGDEHEHEDGDEHEHLRRILHTELGASAKFNTSVHAEYYNFDLHLYVVHNDLCCNDVSVDIEPHHACSFDEFLEEFFLVDATGAPTAAVDLINDESSSAMIIYIAIAVVAVLIIGVAVYAFAPSRLVPGGSSPAPVANADEVVAKVVTEEKKDVGATDDKVISI